MKNKSYSIFSVFVLALFFCASCNNSDDEGGDSNSNTFTSTCCQVPHLEVCLGGARVFVPNAFTPDANGFNDLFYPFGDEGIEYITSLKVFNGNETIHEASNFQVNNSSFGWDGTLSDGTIEQGIYTYTISIENTVGESGTFDGTVCLRAPFGFPCVDLEDHCAYGSQHDGVGGFDFTLPSFETCQ